MANNSVGLEDTPFNDPVVIRITREIDSALSTLSAADQSKALAGLLMTIAGRMTDVSGKIEQANAAFKSQFSKESIAKKKAENMDKWANAMDRVANQGKMEAAKQLEAQGFKKVSELQDGTLRYFHPELKGVHVNLKTNRFEVTKNDISLRKVEGYQSFSNVIAERKNWK